MRILCSWTKTHRYTATLLHCNTSASIPFIALHTLMQTMPNIYIHNGTQGHTFVATPAVLDIAQLGSADTTGKSLLHAQRGRMLRSKSFVKVTNRGNVVKVVKEHYLRDDIPCGIKGCPNCLQINTLAGDAAAEASSATAILLDPLQEPSSHASFANGGHLILIPDTNIILHHLDILETRHFHDVVILQTVLEEVRHQNTGVYARIRSIIGQANKRFYVFSNEHHRNTFAEKLPNESDNDRNDRAIRLATAWYTEHVAKHALPMVNVTVCLLTNDVANAEKAHALNLCVYQLATFIAGLPENDELLDMIESAREATAKEDQQEGYEEHLSNAALLTGIKAGKYLQGSINVSPYNPFEGNVFLDGVGGEYTNVVISGRLNMNRAVHGDTIVLEVLPKNQWGLLAKDAQAGEEENAENANITASFPALEATPEQPEIITDAKPAGKVVGILKRNWRAYCGSIDKRSIKPHDMTQNVLFLPMDRRIPRVRVRTRQAHHLASQRILISIDSWEKNSKYPCGHLVRQLGTAGDKATETEAILLEHDVAYTDFTPQVLACLPDANWCPTEADYNSRADFRDLDICSIDPPGCTDIDDALHARPLPNGNYEVGVHIADVTHFVKAASAMDQEASSRATTVYLVDKRIDMLPALLGTNLCSLKSNVERFAFSCIWEMSPSADLINVRFTKSIIKSRASFTYDEAQARLDNPTSNDPLSTNLRVLNTLAKQLRLRRIAAGALTLASPEVRFNLDTETQNPVDVELKEMKEANSLVEEFMLLANISVAQQLHSFFPDTALLRRHPSPPVENFEALNKALAVLDMNLDVSTSRALADSLDKAIIPNDAYFNKLVRIMTTRCMLQAVYFASGTVPQSLFWHYGLAAPIYTHFTSPIRRYSDVIVHRLLAASINAPGSTSSGILFDKQRLEDVCHNLNYRHRMAQQAQRSSVELYTHLFFRDKSVREEAYVIKIMQSSFVVIIPKYGVEGVISMSESILPADITYCPEFNHFVTLNADHVKAVMGDASTASTAVPFPVIRLFQRVIVEVSIEQSDSTQRQRLHIALIEPAILPTGSSSEQAAASSILQKRKITAAT